MLDTQVIVDLSPKVCAGVDLVNHALDLACTYRGAAAIALANKTIGQTAMNTIIPKATSSDK